MTASSKDDNADVSGTPVPTNEEDDLSVSTSKAGSSSSENEEEMNEITVCFDFQPNRKINEKKILTSHAVLLSALLENFDKQEIQIYGNDGEIVKEVKLGNSFSSKRHGKKFAVHTREPTKFIKHPRFTIIHRIRTTQSLYDIRHSPHFMDKLKDNDCYMKKHFWAEDIHNIAHIGHLIALPTQYYTEDDASQRIIDKILKSDPDLKVDDIPMFKIKFSSPGITNDKGKKTNTKAYAVEAQRGTDATELIDMLQLAYEGTNLFLFAQMRRKYPKAYAQAIRYNNSILSKVYVVPLMNISPEMKTHMETTIMAIDGVMDIVPTRRTLTDGRYFVMTDIDKFEATKQILANQWGTILEAIPQEVLDDNHFPNPRVASRARRSDDASVDSKRSYLTQAAQSFMSVISDVSCTFELTKTKGLTYAEATRDDKPPAVIKTKPPAEEATPVPESTPAATSQTGISDLSASQLQTNATFLQTIADLRIEIAETNKAMREQTTHHNNAMREQTALFNAILQKLDADETLPLTQAPTETLEKRGVPSTPHTPSSQESNAKRANTNTTPMQGKELFKDTATDFRKGG